MRKYEIIRSSIEILYKNREAIKEGVTLTSYEQNPMVIEQFDVLADALAELKKYKTNIRELSGGAGKYFHIEEFYVEENVYYNDGLWIEGGDVYEFSKITIELVEKPSYKTLGTYDNMSDAEDALNSYEGDYEVFLSFS